MLAELCMYLDDAGLRKLVEYQQRALDIAESERDYEHAVWIVDDLNVINIVSYMLVRC